MGQRHIGTEMRDLRTALDAGGTEALIRYLREDQGIVLGDVRVAKLLRRLACECTEAGALRDAYELNCYATVLDPPTDRRATERTVDASGRLVVSMSGVAEPGDVVHIQRTENEIKISRR